MKTFKTLYKMGSTGKLCQWSIRVEGVTIKEEWGQVGGKLQTTEDTIKAGKNLGKANETTPEQQAESEAQSKYEKKLKAHNYTEVKSDAIKGKASKVVEGGVLPMLAKRYDEDGDKIVWPAYGQRKYDGFRCIAIIDSEGEVTLWSRTRKPINSMIHIQEALKALKLSNVILDGELYRKEHHDGFEELSHLIRQVKPEPGCETVQYHVYDAVMEGPFSERTEKVATMLKGAEPCIEIAQTELLETEDDMLLLFERFLKEGMEGLMIRNAKGLYVNKRSSDLQKVKTFIDAEFRIVGIIEGRGRLSGHGIFACETKEGVQFEAKMLGSTEKLKKYYENPESYVGKMLTVKFQGLTTKNKVPRFPVALRVFEPL